MENKTFNPQKYKAVLFDMDGVLTQTAKVHASCWKKMFDEFLYKYSEKEKIPFKPFTIEQDYKHYVDGKPRLDGVRSFLESRSITLPEEADSHHDSIRSLGDRKNELIHEVIKTEGVEVYEGSIKFINHIHSQGLKTAVVTSSRNCEAIINAAGIQDLFDTRVDGNVAVKLRLTGKPAPDIFIEAAKNLGVTPEDAVVVELHREVVPHAGHRTGAAGMNALGLGLAVRTNAP